MRRLPPFDKIGVDPAPDFVNADPTNGVAGSIVNGDIFNQLQHEGENLVLFAGSAPDGTNLTQWTQAASRGGIWAGGLTGTGDLAVATLGAVLPALLQGMRIGAIATAANTVANPKLRVVNLGSTGAYVDLPIIRENGTAIAIGDIKAGRRYRFEADGAGNVMISGGGIDGGGAQTIINNLSIVGGRLLGQWSTAGTYAWTCPADESVRRVLVEGIGAGAGGGVGNGYSGAGGTGGNYFRGVFSVTPGAVYTIVVGKGGNAGAGSTYGDNGGLTSFGPQGGTVLYLGAGGAGGEGGGNPAHSNVGYASLPPPLSGAAFPFGGVERQGGAGQNGLFWPTSPVTIAGGQGGGSALASATTSPFGSGSFQGTGPGGGGSGGAGSSNGGPGASGYLSITG